MPPQKGGFFRGDLIGKEKNPSVRAFSMLFGAFKAMYRRCSAWAQILDKDKIKTGILLAFFML